MKVGVIGAGTMGSGIAQAFAQTEGYEVCLCDINEEFAANGKAKIAKGLEKRVARGKMEQAAADAILAKIISLSTGFSALGAGIAVAAAAPAAIGAFSENEKNFGKSLIFVALGEGVAIYGLLISILIINKI